MFAAAAFAVAWVVSLDARSDRQGRSPAPPSVPSPAGATMPVDAQNKLVAATCVACHSDRGKAGGLSLEGFDAAKLEQNAEVAEKMIRKLRAGMMPPPTARNRPDAATLNQLAASLEAPLDKAAAEHPNPGRRMFQRLNRTEYGLAVRDLLDLDVDVSAFLPPDTFSHGFDNISDEQASSPMLIQSYLSAATKIASLALGDRSASATEVTFRIPRTASQMEHVEGAPWGTRGGISIVHTFPADGDYTFRMLMHAVPTGELFGSTVRDEQIEVSVNGERAALLTIDYRLTEASENGLNLVTPPIRIKAGPQRITAAFIQRFESPLDDLIAPHEHTLADTIYGTDVGITSLPHLRDFSITGPLKVSGISETPSRKKILTCHPSTPAQEGTCAFRIVKRLASQAYRLPESSVDVEALMKFYTLGRKEGDFEDGIRRAVQAVLASPRFLFRLEEAPATAHAGENYRISDLELASRLSYFLWSSGPDAELLKLATAHQLRTPAVLEKQVRRMLADPRSESLSTRFAAQWLRLQDIAQIQPDAVRFPSYNYQLALALKRETELFFDSIVREDRNVLDLLTADYTFVNERVARHYGIPNITGDEFRRVSLGPGFAYRRGLLGQGSIHVLTSVPDRTSPVLRGKWIMEVFLGTPPPPPPPNVPTLDETKAVTASGAPLSTRQRMEEHRKNPACASCHRVIDPLGLTLENFDVIGKWRIKDNDVAVDANGELYDGTKMSGPDGLRQALLAHSVSLLRNFSENLMKYAVGRRIEYFDQPAIRGIVRTAAGNDNRFSSFVLGVATSAAFQMSRAEDTNVAERRRDLDNAHPAGGPVKEPRR